MSDLPNVAAWKAHILRLTAFPLSPGQVEERGWWEAVTGTEPETVTRRKPERTYEGVLNNTSLQLAIDPFRVQWVETPIMDPNDIGDEFPNLGAYPDAADSFSRLLTPWLETCPPLKRLAFGAVLLLPVKDHRAGYEMLNAFLPFIELSADTSDLQFRINRRRESQTGIGDLKINRLMTWSLQKWEVGIRAIQPSLPAPIPAANGFACRLELDINTDQNFDGELPQVLLSLLWRELTDMAAEIATKGDTA